MTLKYILKNLNMVERNSLWLKSDISLITKIRFYFDILFSYVLYIATNKKQIRYLGTTFRYDNPATPLNLQTYPHEIGHTILHSLDKKPARLLDLGANIGQFSITFSRLSPETKIDCFEPNKDIFEILQFNTKNLSNITAYNYGIGYSSDNKLSYKENSSGTGSLIVDDNSKNTKQIEIKLTDKPSSFTKTEQYDLVKIDVEGYEYKLLECLKAIKTSYLYIELSGMNRINGYNHSEMFKLIESKFGAFNIISSKACHAQSNTYEILLKFINQ